MKQILIDTRIWVLALKLPLFKETDFDYPLSIKARECVDENLKNNGILISSQLASEIYSVLTTRGRKLPSAQAAKLVKDILERENVTYKVISIEVFKRAMDLSAESGIHIWDFLVVLPFEGEIDLIYTMDPHFRDKSLNQIAKIENPIGVWKKEGQS